MQQYSKPTVDVIIFDSCENVMKVSSVNINTANIVPSAEINTIGKWNS